jgi:hypothetical protein
MALKPKTIEHLLFGELRWMGIWTKTVQMPIFGRLCTLLVLLQGDEAGVFDQNQVLAYQSFFQALDNRIFRIERAAFRYYEVINEDLRNAQPSTEVADQIAPKIQHLEALYPLVTPLEILFAKGKALPTAGFLADCSWDHKNGLAVLFEGEALTEVGTREILL